MDIEIIKKIIKRHSTAHAEFVTRAMEAERYYDNESDILYLPREESEGADRALRNADNRIPRNFFGLLVDQKAAYAMTEPPKFDVDNDTLNAKITEILGDKYHKNSMQLAVDASVDGVGWVHYWRDEAGEFRWGRIDPKQVCPIWTGDLDPQLAGVLRTYQQIDEDTGDVYTIYEYWDDTVCEAYRLRAGDELDEGLRYYLEFADPETGEPLPYLQHDCGEVPFVAFWNNARHASDLRKIKELIDVYDKVYSGFINDLDDVQELIFILTGYGGTDLAGFLQDLKRYKTIKLDDKTESGLETLNIQIPIEARNSVLEATERAIYDIGRGYDPHPESFGNASGVALKFMYAALEQKTGLLETEFRVGFGRLVRAICRMTGAGEIGQILQTWRRTAIQNDVEIVSICQQSVGLVSTKTILQHHPFVEDAEAEMEALKAEKLQSMEDFGFGLPAKRDETQEDDDDEDENSASDQDGV